MILALVIIALATALLGGYTFAFQKATLHWGCVFTDQPTEDEIIAEQRAKGESEASARSFAAGFSIKNRGAQDAITPWFQIIRNFLFPVLVLVVVPGFAVAAFRWWAAPIAILVTFIFAGFLTKLFPQPSSVYFLLKIRKGLEEKINDCRLKGDPSRVEAGQFFLKKVDDALN